MEWPHSNRRKSDPPARSGPTNTGPGTNAAARGAFKCRRKGLGILPSRRPVIVAHNNYEQCKSIRIAARIARESRGLVVMLVSGWVQKREFRVRTPRAQ
eukprot:6859692-Prymnesium_polylepis.1